MAVSGNRQVVYTCPQNSTAELVSMSIGVVSGSATGVRYLQSSGRSSADINFEEGDQLEVEVSSGSTVNVGVTVEERFNSVGVSR